ncbi:MAG: leucine-rich repeat domain-containing protein [Clostridia bacterium]|nr:leucine-rich repeat domain-containing protein [Clostridia bacterium]
MKNIIKNLLILMFAPLVLFNSLFLGGCSENDSNFDFNIPETNAEAFYYQINDNEIYITGLTKYGRELKELHIPEQIEGKYVVGLKNAELNSSSFDFSDLDETSFICDVKTIVLPCTIKTISRYFFTKTTANAIKINGELGIIPNYSFRNANIKHVFVEDGVVEIGEGAFLGSDIETISLPSSLRVIQDSAFKFCEKLNRVDISEGLEKINSFAFSACYNLKVIVFPNSLKYIGAYVFSPYSYYEEMKIEKVVIGKSIETIDNSAFQSCSVVLYCYTQKPPCANLTGVKTYYVLEENYIEWVDSGKINSDKITVFDPDNIDLSTSASGCSPSFNYFTCLGIVFVVGIVLTIVKEIIKKYL